MRSIALGGSLCGLLLMASPSWGQTPNLQPESQQEFRRTFGFGGGQGMDQGSPANRPSVRQGLQPDSIAEFDRVFGSNAILGTANLQQLATPATINSTILNAVTKIPDRRRYFALWHLIAVDLTAIDHRANLALSPTTYHEQFGPARTARALALIHQAMFEAANVFEHRYASTLPDMPVVSTSGVSADATLVEAAYQIMSWLYPGLGDQPVEVDDPACAKDQFSLPTYYACSLKTITDVNAKSAGVELGRLIAGQIISARARDGSDLAEPVFGKDFVPRQAPGAPTYPFTQWQQDPVSQFGTALGGYWGSVRPFALTSGFQFRPPEEGSPAFMVRKLLDSNPNPAEAYRKLPSYTAVRQWGKETRLEPSGTDPMPAPSLDGRFLAQFWAYDATANLCAPARLYNQIAAKILAHLEEHAQDGYPNLLDTQSIVDVARFYALVNMAMGDAAIAAWDAKYHFQFPRPVTYIRAYDLLTGAKPTATKWFPIGAQVTNSDQTYNITPPFPSYPSGHAVFGGALFGVLRQFVRPSATFTFLSDELNGKNKDVFNYVRCSDNDKFTPQASKFCKERSFTMDCAERENADSRVFMGVHWVFDADDGIVMGNKVARQVYHYAMKPISQTGQTNDPSSHLFSVDPGVKTRADLLCPAVALPAGWDDTDPTKGFGPFHVVAVDAF